jgi:alkylated DNA repair dioxygenase AlkB
VTDVEIGEDHHRHDQHRANSAGEEGQECAPGEDRPQTGCDGGHQQQIKIFGKEVCVPRLTAWYGDKGMSYSYSGITVNPLPWTPALLEIRDRVGARSGTPFNSVLLNQYRTGADSVAWHADDEPELGLNPIIASVSFGGTRKFQLKHKTRKEMRHSLDLTCGSLLLMRGKTQHHWLHQVPKTKRAVETRVNLTFRVINRNADEH